MKKLSIEISFEEEQLSALKQYMAKKELSAENELEEALKKMYEKYVPQQVREYIESREEITQVDRKVYTKQKKSKQQEQVNIIEVKEEKELLKENLVEQ